MNNDDKLLYILSCYDSIVNFEIDFKDRYTMERPVKRKDIWGKEYDSTNYIFCPAICKITIYINEAWYVADRLFHPALEEQLETLNGDYYSIKYTIKFVEPLEEQALETIKWRKNSDQKTS